MVHIPRGMLMKNKLMKIYLYILGIPKTIYFNLKYFKIKDAIKLPILVSHRVYLMKSEGKILIDRSVKIKPGMVKLGFGEVGIFDQHKSRSIWQVSGIVVFKGKAAIGHGFKISVGPRGKLTLGNNFLMTAESQIVCHKEIEFGDNVLMSWENLIMDTDFHIIKDDLGNVLNSDKKILIGNHVWIGCRCTILKGTKIGNNNIIAANSLITGDFSKNERVIIGGNPAKIIKTNVDWDY
jgi:acetyltransferase-like isoleucine patch superfamily enzyme